jgi:2-phosphoglycerate kinase
VIYFVAGASRSGKTYMAKKLMVQLGVPLLELDYLKMGFAYGVSDYGIHPLQDEATIGKRIWPIVSGMIKAMIENEDDYIVEGCYILPEYADQARKQYGDKIRACFLGYADMLPSDKLAEVRQYGGNPGDNLRHYTDDEAMADIQHFIKYSHFVRTECRRFNLPYIEVGNREKSVREAINSILKGNGEPSGSVNRQG